MMETELKLNLVRAVDMGELWPVVSRSRFIRKIAAPAAWLVTNMATYHYDTPDRRLYQAGVAYRVRREGEQYVATVKAGGSSSGGLHQRQEWNVESPSAEPDLGLWSEQPIGERLQALVGTQPLLPLVTMNFVRRSALYYVGETCIEVAVDEGWLEAGGLNEPIQELEFEVKQGQTAVVFDLAAQLAEELPVVPAIHSKFARAARLLGLESVEPIELLTADQSLAQALPTVLTGAIYDVFVAYQEFQESLGAAKLKQVRFKLTQLVAMLSFCRPHLNEAEVFNWKQELRQCEQLFSAVSDLDLVMAVWPDLKGQTELSLIGQEEFVEFIERRRRKLLKALSRELKQRCLSVVLFELWGWLGRHSWGAEHKTSIGGYAEWRLGGWLNTLLAAGKILDWSNSHDRERLQQPLQNVLAVLPTLTFYQGRRTQKLLKALKAMDSLFTAGVQRAVVASQLALVSGSSRKVGVNLGLLTGWVLGTTALVRDRDQEAWNQLKKASKRWLDS